MILAVEDDPRSHFGQYGPQEPTLKILKRPQDTEGRTGGDNRPKAPVKSLQQREQEYAEARLRILGSAKSPEEEQKYLSKSVIAGEQCLIHFLFSATL